MLKLNEPVIVGPTETKFLTKMHLVYSAKTSEVLEWIYFTPAWLNAKFKAYYDTFN